MKLGFDGVKIMDTHPEFRAYLGYGICDRPYSRAFEYMEENGIPINMHAIDPHTWWNKSEAYDKPYIPKPEKIYSEIFKFSPFIAKNPLDLSPHLRI